MSSEMKSKEGDFRNSPYENTVQVPGRDLFVESKKRGSDPFEVSSLIANSGKISIEVTAKVSAASLYVHTPNSDGSFASKPPTNFFACEEQV